jgi:glycosyltransferase involved in cell wall biosynthesis
MPAHNEAVDVGRVVRAVRAHCDYPVVVVDDASTDETAAVARDAGATVVPLAYQLGAWGAMQAGLRYAQAHGFEYVITMDADGQHEAESIGELVRPVLEGRADIAIGTCPDRGSRLRRIAWVLMKRASGLTLEDITSGFRLYCRPAVELLAGKSATLLEFQDVGVLIALQEHDFRIVDVPVPMPPRRSGISRIFYSWRSVTYYMAHTMLLSVTKRKYRKPRAARDAR